MITFYTYIQSFNLESIYFFNGFLLKAISNILPFEIEPFLLFEGLSCLIFIFSLTWLFRIRSEFSFIPALLLGVLVTLSVTYIGASSLPVIVFSPLIFLILIRHYATKRCGILIQSILIVLEVLTYLLSNVLALFYYGVSRIIITPNHENKFKKILELFFAFTSCYIFFYFSKLCEVFDYPKDARLFDINSIQQMGEVIFGTERLPFSLLPQIFMHERFSIIESSMLLLFPVFLANASLGRKNSLGIPNYQKYFVYFLFLVVFVTSFFNSSTFLYSPEGILYSVLPGLIWRVYPWFFVLLFFILYLIYSLSNKSFASRYIYFYLFYFVFISYFFGNPKQDVFITSKAIDNIDVEKTPSSFLLKEYSLSKNALPKKDDRFEEINKINTFCTVQANRNQNDINNVLDDDIHSIWRTLGNQKTGDSITISCDKNIDFNRIIISSGANGTDFPRGFQIEVGETIENLNLIKKLPHWMGKVERTEKGLPYFGPQHEEYVDFNSTQSGKIIKITLLRGSDVFDWSVAEVMFFGVLK